jgi:3-deoxy-7-phosphoheptulonate synthase
VVFLIFAHDFAEGEIFMIARQRLTNASPHRRRVVRAGTAAFGDGSFALIGGPCSVEDAEQIATVARTVCDARGAMLRGGVWKTRTSPYDFQGLGDKGLTLLGEQRDLHGVPIVVEALSEDHVDALSTRADMIQIGARSMQNVPLLRAAGRTRKSVLLKRGASATLDELLSAAEYILLEGNHDVVLCERGIRSFDQSTRNVLDLGGALRLKELTSLPVIVDPSHASGRRSLVEPLTLAAAAAGLDGAIVEVHPDPDRALSDAAQSIDCATFQRIAHGVAKLRFLQDAIAMAG